jgi:hypothetical protein
MARWTERLNTTFFETYSINDAYFVEYQVVATTSQGCPFKCTVWTFEKPIALTF